MPKESNQALVVYICNHGHSYDAMHEARLAGATGGTILHGKSSVPESKQKFFGITLNPEKDVILIVTTNEAKDNIMKALTEKHGSESPARGVCFSLKVTESIGLRKLS